MKTSFTVPLLIAALAVTAIYGMGMLAVRASAISTQASIDLLRIQLRVANLHQQLLRHSRDGLAAESQALGQRVPTLPEASPAQPWRERAGDERFDVQP